MAKIMNTSNITFKYILPDQFAYPKPITKVYVPKPKEGERMLLL